MSEKILILGGTGTLGVPVTRHLAEKGHTIRVLTRSPDTARKWLGDAVEIVEGDSTDKETLERSIDSCSAVHISLPTDSELVAVQHLVASPASMKLKRISYVSGTSVRDENRWFELIERKARAEALIRASGIPYILFCPTWVMEVLHKFVRGDKAVVISGKNSPPIHFFAADDFGRMVASAYEDERAVGKRLFIHGPNAISLPDALNRLLKECYPHIRATYLKLWQARLIARLTGRMDAVSRLIRYFEKVGELGDPSEANAILGAPSTTLDDWIAGQRIAIK